MTVRIVYSLNDNVKSITYDGSEKSLIRFLKELHRTEGLRLQLVDTMDCCGLPFDLKSVLEGTNE